MGVNFSFTLKGLGTENSTADMPGESGVTTSHATDRDRNMIDSVAHGTSSFDLTNIEAVTSFLGEDIQEPPADVLKKGKVTST